MSHVFMLAYTEGKGHKVKVSTVCTAEMSKMDLNPRQSLAGM